MEGNHRQRVGKRERRTVDRISSSNELFYYLFCDGVCNVFGLATIGLCTWETTVRRTERQFPEAKKKNKWMRNKKNMKNNSRNAFSPSRLKPTSFDSYFIYFVAENVKFISFIIFIHILFAQRIQLNFYIRVSYCTVFFLSFTFFWL